VYPECLARTRPKEGVLSAVGQFHLATSLAECAVNALDARCMAKMQQMRWSGRAADLRLQVRTVVLNGDLEHQLADESPRPVDKSRLACFSEQTLPVLKAS
jgi:hypothetical protein